MNYFEWTIPKAGFRIVTGLTTKSKYLVHNKTRGLVTRYNPLESPSLFLDFVDSKPAEEGILAFANQYGWLGEETLLKEKSWSEPLTNSHTHGELLKVWASERQAMREAFVLYGNLKDHPRLLKDYIFWRDKESVRYKTDKKSAWITTPKIYPERLQYLKYGDCKKPAQYFIQDVINKHLDGRVSPKLLWNDDRSELKSYLVPNSLIGCMWLQFFMAVDERKEFKRCKVCGKWFEVHKSQRGQPRKTCSNACRMKLSRNKRAKK